MKSKPEIKRSLWIKGSIDEVMKVIDRLREKFGGEKTIEAVVKSYNKKHLVLQ